MQAGKMKYRIEILEPEYRSDGFGEEAETFISRGTARAERVKLTGNRSEEAGEHFPDYSVRWNIRDAHKVEENWRVRQLGGYVYTVTNIIPNRDRGMLTLVCERVNP